MSPKVSIIVPIYNAGIFLSACLDSLLAQTLKDIEIILVLDCPIDGSDVIAEMYADKDKRIKIIRNNQNLNTGLSRNEGLKVATGEYIGFSDHDDYCHPSMFETLYNAAKNSDADIVISNVGECVNGVEYTTGFPVSGYNDFREAYLRALIKGEPAKCGTIGFNNANSIWNQIYKRELLNSNDILFPDNRELTYEDSLFNIKAYTFAKKVEFVSETLYFHRTTNSNTFNRYEYRQYCKFNNYVHGVISFLKEQGLFEEYKNEMSSCAFSRLYTSMLNELRFNGFKAMCKVLKDIKKDAEVMELIKSVKPESAKKTVLKYIVYKCMMCNPLSLTLDP